MYRVLQGSWSRAVEAGGMGAEVLQGSTLLFLWIRPRAAPSSHLGFGARLSFVNDINYLIFREDKGRLQKEDRTYIDEHESHPPLPSPPLPSPPEKSLGERMTRLLAYEVFLQSVS